MSVWLATKGVSFLLGVVFLGGAWFMTRWKDPDPAVNTLRRIAVVGAAIVGTMHLIASYPTGGFF